MEDDEAYPDGPRPAGRTCFAITASALALGVATMVGAATHGADTTAPPLPDTAARQAAPAVPPAAAAPLPAAVPTWLAIPRIGVEAPLVGVGLDPAGWLDAPPPELAHLAGWYRDAVTPGERGTAVIVGHVDGLTGPAVFYDLGTLEPGDTIDVTREDGRRLRFAVYDIAVYAKNRLPSRVYDDTGHAELRVITCGGSYLEGSGYQDNVVVFARLSSTR